MPGQPVLFKDIEKVLRKYWEGVICGVGKRLCVEAKQSKHAVYRHRWKQILGCRGHWSLRSKFMDDLLGGHADLESKASDRWFSPVPNKWEKQLRLSFNGSRHINDESKARFLASHQQAMLCASIPIIQ